MKSPLLAFTISLLIFQGAAFAQGAFFDAGFGFGFSAGDRLGTESPNGVGQNVYGSFGKGLSIGLGTGYMVNDNVGLDLGIWYMMGSSYQFSVLDTTGKAADQVSGKTVRIIPSLKISSEQQSKLYAKFGLVLGIGTMLEGDETFTSSQGTIFSSFQYTGGTSFGWMGAVGIDFNENQAASVFLELNFCHQNFSPELLTETVPGVPQITYHLVDNPNPAAKDELIKPFFPFSTIGITAGVKFSSAKKKTGS